ncbi:unnamed protein product [Clonostachys rhizophaga]|uniref:AAR2 protein n=1 Tax=Clonostachys rhizophaga TaxID=160324 RepID=A0A9N9V732_9HYPO|nr:unnamed protein product [Clonostachys rhizophaga]
MDPGKSSPRQGMDRIIRSVSNRSSGGLSTKSHDSVSVVGPHPLGTLRVHQPDQPSPLAQSGHVNNDADDSPPPLDGDEPMGDIQLPIRQPQRPSVMGDRLSHEMGGGDVILVLDLPEVFTVGYDSLSFNAKHFGGIRDFPSGAHFIWTSHPSGTSTRCGVWVISSHAHQVHVLQWDKYNEMLSEPSRTEARIQADNLESIHKKLVPYNDPTAVNTEIAESSNVDEALRLWAQLTSGISEVTLNRITGQVDGHYFVNTTDRVKGSTLIAAEIELEKRISTSVLQNRELNFSFSQLSKTFSTSDTGAKRTFQARDATPYLLSLVHDSTVNLSENDIVGEFQFAFLVGMHLGNDACMQQWWHMVLKIILRAYLLPIQRPILAAELLRCLAAQLSYSNSNFDTSILDYSESQSRELRLALILYKRRIEELFEYNDIPDQLAVVTAFAQVESTVALPPLGWDLRSDNYVRSGKIMLEDGEEIEVEMGELEAEDERGEYAPEVVELDERGNQRGLVSWSD